MSCLFYSLSFFIDNVDTHQLRQMIADYLETDPYIDHDQGDDDPHRHKFSQMISFVSDFDSLPNYVRHLRLQSTWGGAIEIKAFCDMFHVIVEVIVQHTQKSIEFCPSSNTNKRPTTRFRLLWNGSHYEPVSSPPPPLQRG